MSAVTSLPTRARRAHPATQAASMRTLVAVELRKMVDTKAGRWMLAGLAASVVATLAIVIVTGKAGDRSFTSLFGVSQVPVSVLLPLLAVLAATSEWGQRTALTTFALVPSRGRVLRAKLGAVVLIALATVPFTLAAGALAALLAPLAGAATADWQLGISDVGEALVYQQFSILWGFALGVLVLNSAAAIVLFFVAPMTFAALNSSISWLADVGAWTDSAISWDPLFDAGTPMTATSWAQAGVTAIVWIALPLAVGTWRMLRKEVD